MTRKTTRIAIPTAIPMPFPEVVEGCWSRSAEAETECAGDDFVVIGVDDAVAMTGDDGDDEVGADESKRRVGFGSGDIVGV